MPDDTTFLRGLAEGMRRRARVGLAEWAEANLVLPSERASAPGPYRISRAPFQRGMLDAIVDPDNDEFVFMTSSQVGKSTVIAAVQCYYAEQEPCPQIGVYPTDDTADEHEKEAFTPLTNSSPSLRVLFDKRAGAKGRITASHKSYPGGYIAFVSANNPKDLAARPVRVATCDEVDRFPSSTGKEGSPLSLVRRRQTTFSNRKLILASTPVLKSLSQIAPMYDLTDKRKYMVVCDDCDTPQELVWENVVYEKGGEIDAMYACAHCGVLWDDFRRRELIREAEARGGGWMATKESSRRGLVGFHVSALYSPWRSLSDIAHEWSEAEGKPQAEQAFYNTTLGLPYDSEVSRWADPERLTERREEYDGAVVPAQAAIVTVGVDVQDDRIEILPVAWGRGEECWLLRPIVIRNDFSVPQAQQELIDVLSRPWLHASGKRVPTLAAAIDSGGHFTQSVYDFAARHKARSWYAIRGVSSGGSPNNSRPIWTKSNAKLGKGRDLYLVGVDDAKSTIYKRYGTQSPGPGYIHLGMFITPEQVKQLTVERAEVDYQNGFPKQVWRKNRRDRNEMLDMLVYAYAARCSKDVDIDYLLAQLNRPESMKSLDPYSVGALFK